MKVLSVQKSKQNTIKINGEDVPSGIHKTSCDELVLTVDGVEGDFVSELKFHGGEFKAVYSYDRLNYPLWEQLKIDSPGGSMSENITTEGLYEEDLYIGDRLNIGEVVLEVTQPRFPCQKLNIKLNDDDAIKNFSNWLT